MMGWEALRSTKRASQPIMADAEGLPRRKGPAGRAFQGQPSEEGIPEIRRPHFLRGPACQGFTCWRSNYKEFAQPRQLISLARRNDLASLGLSEFELEISKVYRSPLGRVGKY
jgi:hypothetical protein